MNAHFKFYLLFAAALVMPLSIIGSGNGQAEPKFFWTVVNGLPVIVKVLPFTSYITKEESKPCNGCLAIKKGIEIGGGNPAVSTDGECYEKILKTYGQAGCLHDSYCKIDQPSLLATKLRHSRGGFYRSFHFSVEPAQIEVSNLLKAIALVRRGCGIQEVNFLKFVGFGAESARQEKTEHLVCGLIGMMPVFDLAASEVSAEDVITRFDQEFGRLNFPHVGSLDDLSGALQALQTGAPAHGLVISSRMEDLD